MICGDENGTNECHLAAFSVDIALACHFMASHHLHSPPSVPIGVLVVLGTSVKIYLKWQAIQLETVVSDTAMPIINVVILPLNIQ